MTNPYLERIGLSADDRAVLVHTDDIGMCHASLDAYADLVDFGLISTAAAMVPCPWFPATAAFCRDHAAQVDMGVHVTLTSEWSGYRWRPLTNPEPGSGLIDGAGYFHATRAPVAVADADAVLREVRAQLELALDAGIDVTHIDSHMGTIFNPRYVEGYVEVALEHGIPPLLLRKSRAELQVMGFDAGTAGLLVEQLGALEARGLPLLDDLYQMPLEQPEGREGQVRALLESLPPGTITYLIIHPAKDTPELRAITPDWEGRVTDYCTFTSESMRETFEASGVHLIGFRPLRDALRVGL